MLHKRHIFFKLLVSIVTWSFLLTTFSLAAENSHVGTRRIISINDSISLAKTYAAIVKSVKGRDTLRLQSISDSLKNTFKSPVLDSLYLSELYYCTGISNSLIGRFDEAIKWLTTSILLRQRLKVHDKILGKGLFNLGICYGNLGDYNNEILYMTDYLELSPEIYGESSGENAEAYTSLIGAYVELKNFQKFLDITSLALDLISLKKDSIKGNALALLFQNIGVGYNRMGNYSKSRIYFEEAESVYKNQKLESVDYYINLINALALTYGYLELTEKENEYFEMGTALAIANPSFDSFNLINSYAIKLADDGSIAKGEDLLAGLLSKAEMVYGKNSRYYIDVVAKYAAFLGQYSNKFEKALPLYPPCIEYISTHPEDFVLGEMVLRDYSEALLENGELELALYYIQELLWKNDTILYADNKYKDPPLDSLKAERRVLKSLQLKYRILKEMYYSSHAIVLIENAAYTSETMIGLIDKIRSTISEEESRVILAGQYRNSYLNAIHDYQLCFSESGDIRFLKKAFEFSEKSKAAGLLAATREMNALQFHIPSEFAAREVKLQKEIGMYNALIAKENKNKIPNKNLISVFNRKLISLFKSRDSLLVTFETKFPSYYKIKYTSKATAMEDVPAIIGRSNNYLNYVVSDSLLFVFIVNRKYKNVVTLKIDSLFFKDVEDFRTLLSSPSPSGNARTNFNDFQTLGTSLYRKLIEPVEKYFVSDNLIISPDNLLSYLPFETFLASAYDGNEIVYRKLDYLMNHYNISYTYSTAFIEEMSLRKRIRADGLIAFAPVYSKIVNIDSILNKRQSGYNLSSLPHSQLEADYVAEIAGGKSFTNGSATESLFKKEAGNYNIIHLAMHTYLDDQNPMNSFMLFSADSSLLEDGFLYTYEVYGIPLKAKMVVLSSCNTGYGKYSSGEGVLSLARGFMYSGGRSVVMSLWEVEDRSGTDIVNMFYDKLVKGKRKSTALRNARMSYLKTANQLRSHPYFWSTLIIYGDDAPVFPSRKSITISTIFITSILMVLLYYFRKRRYS